VERPQEPNEQDTAGRSIGAAQGVKIIWIETVSRPT